MGIADWFKTFCSNIAVSGVADIATRYNAITKRLNQDFWKSQSSSAHSLYVGSYGRNTAIRGFSDLDMIMRLPYETYAQYDSHAGNGQSALLQAVRESIKKRYTYTNIGADGQVIQVPFTDGITFEVVPGFVNKDDSFTYPDSNGGGSWRITDPRPEIVAIRRRNDAYNGNVVRLCRMMRSWKEKWDVPIGGLLIDTLAYQFIATYEHRDKSFLYYDFMTRDFFDWMANQDREKSYWKAPGSGQYVYGKGLFQYKARRCCNLAQDAVGYESESPKKEWSAKNRWREIFGSAFPS